MATGVENSDELWTYVHVLVCTPVYNYLPMLITCSQTRPLNHLYVRVGKNP